MYVYRLRLIVKNLGEKSRNKRKTVLICRILEREGGFSMKGIIISPKYSSADNGRFGIKGNVEPQELRQYVLYWDKIDFPTNTFMYFTTPEVDFLEKVGVLQRSRFGMPSSFNSSELGNIFSNMQLAALKNNNEKGDGKWSLSQPNSKLFFDYKNSVQCKHLEVELFNSLPIPSASSSLEDILAFKERRKDELLEFRLLMDNLYLELIKSGDTETAIDVYIRNIQRKIKEIDNVMNESKIKSFRDSVKIRFDLGEAIKNTFIGASSGHIFNFPDDFGVSLGAAIGFASSFIKINSEMSLKPKGIPSDLKDYAYLYYSQKELN